MDSGVGLDSGNLCSVNRVKIGFPYLNSGLVSFGVIQIGQLDTRASSMGYTLLPVCHQVIVDTVGVTSIPSI